MPDDEPPWKTKWGDGAELRPFRIIRWSELAEFPRPEPLIKHLLARGALSVIYGASGSGKTFFALDLALHIALGWHWCGFRTRKGPVLYIAAEAGTSIDGRLTALRLFHSISVVAVEFFVMPDSLDMCRSPAETDQLIQELRERFPGVKFELIVVDTLSRVMGGGNENGPDDMGALIANCDRLRNATGGHVTLLHHTGKDAQRAERGHSALRAAVDTAIEIAYDEASSLHTATVKKQRDGEGRQSFGFNLLSVDIGRDEDDEPITSCVVKPVKDVVSTSRRPKITGQAKLALDKLTEALAREGQPAPTSDHMPPGLDVVAVSLWRGYCNKGGLTAGDNDRTFQTAFRRARENLQNAGLIGIWDEKVWVVRAEGDKAT